MEIQHLGLPYLKSYKVYSNKCGHEIKIHISTVLMR